jgi:HEAT repeat protein
MQMTTRFLSQSLSAVAVLCFALPGVSNALGLDTDVISPIPPPEQQLAELGFSATTDGLQRAIQSTSWRARLNAVRLLAARGDRSLDHHLEALLTDEVHGVRLEAAKLLAKSGKARAVEVLRDFLTCEIKGTHTVFQKIEAAEALADIGVPDGFGLVKAALLDDQHTGSQLAAARVLPRFARFRGKEAEVVQSLIEGADKVLQRVQNKEAKGERRGYDSDNVLFAWIAKGLGDLGDERATEKLEQAASSDDPFVGLAATKALDAVRGKRKQTSSP